MPITKLTVINSTSNYFLVPMLKHISIKTIVASILLVLLACPNAEAKKMPVDYVNPYMGNISHLLMPTFPTTHLPNGMMRVFPRRGSFVETTIDGLPVLLVNHRELHNFNISALQGENVELHKVVRTEYDNEVITPYYFKVDVDEQRVEAEFAPSYHSAIYRFTFTSPESAYIILNSSNGAVKIEGNSISGHQYTWGNVKIYIYCEFDAPATQSGILKGRSMDASRNEGRGDDACAVIKFDGSQAVNFKYAVSFISEEQAKENLKREISDFDFAKVKKAGYDAWNRELGKIEVKGGTEDDKVVFYTSLYRVYERPVNISEYGRHFNPSDQKVYPDNGHEFYTDDWLWDTYRAAHPLRILIDPKVENDMIVSLIRTAEHMGKQWFPTFPAVSGDSRRMNCNHGAAVVADAWAKGLRNFDLKQAHEYLRGAMEDKTLAPWSSRDGAEYNEFYYTHGYVPALAPGERETWREVDGFEKRQPVPVTLGTSYDHWCMSQIAGFLGDESLAAKYLDYSYNYRNLFNPQTSFFHPKDKYGKFIEPFDYRFSGGLGAREYYDENNGWVFRWEVQHNVGDLVRLMGGADKFCRNLDQTFSEWLGRSKFEFYSQLPDHTGNVGQFSMANEPSLHIPYLYNYAGKPWKTQKAVRQLVGEWFRNDLMGVPGDEDGGGMSAFVVFSMMGFYPVTPGSPSYNIGSPFFEEIKIKLGNGKVLKIIGEGSSYDNKYIQSAKLNGEPLNKPWFSHSDIANGGEVRLKMGSKANKAWGLESAPPSAPIK